MKKYLWLMGMLAAVLSLSLVAVGCGGSGSSDEDSLVLGLDPNDYQITNLQLVEYWKDPSIQTAWGSDSDVDPPSPLGQYTPTGDQYMDFWGLNWEELAWFEHGSTPSYDDSRGAKPASNSLIIFYFNKPATNQAEPDDETGEIDTTFVAIGVEWSGPGDDEIRIDWVADDIGTGSTYIAGPYAIERIIELQNTWSERNTAVVIADNSPGVAPFKAECWEPLF